MKQSNIYSLENMVLLASGTLALMSGCGFIESARYTPGAQVEGQQAPNVGVPLDSPVIPSPATSPTQFRELTFDTGITACVASEFSDKNQWIYKPLKRGKTLQDVTMVSEIESAGDFIEGFDLVLRDIVEPNEGLVAYAKIRNGGPYSEIWLKLRNALANLTLNSFQSENEKTSFWVNTYNFLMIDILRDNPAALSSTQRSSTFSRKKHTVSGSSVTLDQIEYGVLRLGGRKLAHPFPVNVTPEKIDNRLHVALVCGAKGCPKLRNFAYEAAKIDVILNENVHMFMNDQLKHVAYDSQSQTVRVSELFQWFSVDFDSFAGGIRPSDVKRYVLKGCRNDTEQLAVFFDSIETFAKLSPQQKIPYDWTSNELNLN